VLKDNGSLGIGAAKLRTVREQFVIHTGLTAPTAVFLKTFDRKYEDASKQICNLAERMFV
jgi:hypothetical protein